MSDKAVKRKSHDRVISLALQGGGAIGAFTWGVLDTLLADGRLSFQTVSGTSAGAMNAVVLADGMERGGRAAAREHLTRFWEGVSQDNAGLAAADEAFDAMSKFWNLDRFSPYQMFKRFTDVVSPYDFNPLNVNPLTHLVEELIDFERLRRSKAMQVYISATNVRTGEARVFSGQELNPSVVLASACLPYLFQAIEIEGEAYWDGGYSGNPSLWPLLEGDSDILLIQLDPSIEAATPTGPEEITDRIRQLTFNNPLLHEMRAIRIIDTLLDNSEIDTSGYHRNRLHRIDATGILPEAVGKQTQDISPRFFDSLRDLGRQAAESWLAQHIDDIGVRDTVDLKAEFP